MNFKLIYFISLFLFSLLTFGQKAERPRWVDYNIRKTEYEDTKFLTGFFSEKVVNEADVNDRLLKLTEYAKQQLVENIVVDISSVGQIYVENINSSSKEILTKSSVSVAKAQIVGLKSETYYDEKKKEIFAFVYASKAELISSYASRIKNSVEKIGATNKTIAEFITKNDIKSATSLQFENNSKLRELEESQGLYIALTGTIDDNALFSKQTLELKNQLDKNLASITSSKEFSIAEAARFLANGLKSSANLDKPLLVSYLNYQDTKFSSTFSRKFKIELESALAANKILVAQPNEEVKSVYLFTGSYWEEKDYLRIIVTIRDNNSNKIIAGLESKIPKSVLESNQISYLPENLKQALENTKAISAGEFKSEGLNVEVWTNKGAESLIFTEGEKMKLSIRSNRECYVRLIYYLADGQKVLLLDNYYINNDKINKVYELPYEFECAEPFGVETLQLVAQSSSFEPLNIQNQDGYDFILDNTQAVLQKTRGFKKVENSLKAEKRITFTTMKK